MVTSEELIGRARDLAPALAKRAAATEVLRAPLDETIKDLEDSGLLPMLTPKLFGGYELQMDTMAQVVAILSAACPSTGWIASFYIGHNWRCALLPEKGQREVFAKRNFALGSGQAAPVLKVKAVPGGYVVSGRAAWSSGIMHAEWVTFGGMHFSTEGPPVALSFVIPRAEVEVIDTWYINGLKGTGSNDAQVNEVFVPEHRTSRVADLLNGTSAGSQLHAGPLYHTPLMAAVFIEPLPVIVGALRGAADAFLELTRNRQTTNTGETVSAKPAARIRLARGLAQTEATEIMLRDYVRILLESGAPQKLRPIAARATMKMKAALIAEFANDTMNMMMRGAGANAFRDSSPMQRFFRDINILGVHAFLDMETAAESCGTLALGGIPTDRLL